MMRSQTACFCASLRNTQLLTSAAVRPQPWQISSNSVEQMPMQGLSGRSASPMASDWTAGKTESEGEDDMQEREELAVRHYKRPARTLRDSGPAMWRHLLPVRSGIVPITSEVVERIRRARYAASIDERPHRSQICVKLPPP
ncbi:hypothetical protein AWV80_18370 [Cupriavidus sp. UYMU48A]|nr:hypothetical protein AWV80_18370 [Cupriavidus sp. UYMU48A]